MIHSHALERLLVKMFPMSRLSGRLIHARATGVRDVVVGIVRSVLCRLLSRSCRPKLDAMGDQLLVHLHGVYDNLVSDLDIGLLDRLFGALVGGHFRVKADGNGLSRCRLDRNGGVRNLSHSAGQVFFAAVSCSDYGQERKRYNREERNRDL